MRILDRDRGYKVRSGNFFAFLAESQTQNSLQGAVAVFSPQACARGVVATRRHVRVVPIVTVVTGRRLACFASEGHDMNRGLSYDGVSSGSAGLSRRGAMLCLGSGGLAALLASSGIPAAAQEISPIAGTPAAGHPYLAIRQYELAPGRTMEELVATVGSGLVPILRQVPGFQEHFLVETSEGMLSISVFADQAGAEESTARAAEWVQQNLADFFAGPPTTMSGSVWRHDVGEAVTGTPAP
jgi:hypothetical protein